MVLEDKEQAGMNKFMQTNHVNSTALYGQSHIPNYLSPHLCSRSAADHTSTPAHMNQYQNRHHSFMSHFSLLTSLSTVRISSTIPNPYSILAAFRSSSL